MKDTNRELMNRIITEYGNDSYVDLSGDRYFENVSSELWKLWYAFPDFSVCTIGNYYKRTFMDEYPDYTSNEFEKDALKLHDALAHEFELLNKANL